MNCLITLKDWVRNDDEIITYLSYIVSMVNCLEEQQIPVPVAGVPQKKIELLSLSGILEGYTYNQIQIPPHSWCESQIKDFLYQIKYVDSQEDQSQYLSMATIYGTSPNQLISFLKCYLHKSTFFIPKFFFYYSYIFSWS